MPDKDKLAALHTIITEQLSKAGVVGITEGAKAIFEDFYITVDETQEEATRIETIVKKLALILAVTNDAIDSEGTPAITPSVARMAVSLADYQLKVRRLLNPSEAVTMYAQAENKLRNYFESHKDTSFTAARIGDRTKLKKTVGMDVVSKAIAALERANEIVVVSAGKAPKYTWNTDIQ